MLELAQNRIVVNIMKHMVIIVGLVRKALVIQKDILQALGLYGLWFNPYRLSLFCWSHVISYRFEAWCSAMREQ